MNVKLQYGIGGTILRLFLVVAILGMVPLAYQCVPLVYAIVTHQPDRPMWTVRGERYDVSAHEYMGYHITASYSDLCIVYVDRRSWLKSETTLLSSDRYDSASVSFLDSATIRLTLFNRSPGSLVATNRDPKYIETGSLDIDLDNPPGGAMMDEIFERQRNEAMRQWHRQDALDSESP